MRVSFLTLVSFLYEAASLIFTLIGQPVRIELFDTEVDSIRDFDVETQRSNDNVEKVDITTASDYIITEDVINHLQTEYKSI